MNISTKLNKNNEFIETLEKSDIWTRNSCLKFTLF